MISIVTVNYNSYDWLNLLIQSLEIFSKETYHLIVVDNSVEAQRFGRKTITQLLQLNNIGHGEGLNQGAAFAMKLNPEYIMFLDVDCHFLREGWERAFKSLMYEFDIVGGRGVEVKPIRPACMFMKPYVATHYDWRATDGYKGHRVTPEGTDVAIAAYHKMREDKLSLGFLDSIPSRYHTLNGEEWCVYGKPYVYHHWHGSHLKERQVDFPDNDLFDDKNRLFSQIPWRQI